MDSRIDLIKHLRAAATDMRMGIHSSSHVAAVEKAAEALESQEVKIETTDESDWRDYCCPRCGVTISQEYKCKKPPYHAVPLYKPNFCADCGQALVWPPMYDHG